MSNHIPKDLKYTSSHEWVRDEGNGTVTIGITDHAQELLGDIVFVELPEVDKKVDAGEECGVVESVKAAADVYCPVAGDIVKVNDKLNQTPELINSDPYGNGWLYQVRLHSKEELSNLMNADNYARELATE